MKATAVLLGVAGSVSVLGLNNGLGRTPQMGWNSWNHFGCGISESLIKSTADAIVSSGLAKAGYTYLNLDDCWEAMQRDANGLLQFNSQNFPSGGKALGDYIHSKGLQFGIYSSAGDATCQGRPASLHHETADAKQFAAWGVDYLKLDNCNNEGIKPEERYPVMRDALNATGRPIFYSLCEWGEDDPATWGAKVANSWRTTGDISSNWNSIMSNIEANDKWYQYAGPGAWNDPDMLEVGNSGITLDEAKSHFALWCVAKAPLLIGCDVTKIDNDTMSILTNEEAIAINQDALGVQGHNVAGGGGPGVDPDPRAGDAAAIYPCAGGTLPAGQRVTWDASAGTLTIPNGLCLTVSNQTNPTNGAPVVDWQACGGAAAPKQKWAFQSGSKAFAQGGQCLDVDWQNTAPGTGLEMYDCNNQQNQAWDVDAGNAKVTSVQSGFCLSAEQQAVGSAQIWAGPLANGDVAVAMINRGNVAAQFSLNFTDVGLSRTVAVRDVYARADKGTFNGVYPAGTINPHGVAFLRLKPMK